MNENFNEYTSLSMIESDSISIFKRKCIKLDSDKLTYCFTYVLHQSWGGRDLVEIYQHTETGKFYIQRVLTETRTVGIPQAGLLDERAMQWVGYCAVSDRTAMYMAQKAYKDTCTSASDLVNLKRILGYL